MLSTAAKMMNSGSGKRLVNDAISRLADGGGGQMTDDGGRRSGEGGRRTGDGGRKMIRLADAGGGWRILGFRMI